MNETKSVFISYKSEEFDDANWIKTTLENNGITCWMAPLSIQGGLSYAAEIPKAIRECKIFVLLLSEKSQESKWVPRELDQAINEGKIIMPFMMEQCRLKDDFNFYLSNVQRYDAYINKAAVMEKMIKEIKAILNMYESKETPEDGEAVSRQEEASSDEAHKDEKTQEIKEKKISSKKERRMDKKKIFGIAGAAIILFVLIVSLFKFGNQVTIGGKEVALSDNYLYLRDVTLSREDVTNIAKMEELTMLTMTNCVLPDEDLGAFCNEKMYILELENCQLTDEHLASIDFGKMECLKTLDIQKNPEISDISMLADVADTLKSLSITDTAVQDFEVLREFGRLEYLAAENLGFEDLSLIENNMNLKELYLDGNQMKSLEVLSKLASLQVISVNNNQLSSLKGLENHIRLKEIYAGYNNLTTLEGLENTTLLETVFLNNNEIEDISILGKSAAALKAVYVNHNKLANLASLENCTLLKYLSADDNQIESVAALANCSALEQLSLAGNKIASLEGLQNCVLLKYLNLSENAITDTSILAETVWNEKEALIWNLSSNKIATLSLPKGVGFTFLDLHGNAITNLDVLSETSGSGVAFQYSESADYSKIANAEFVYMYLLDCPLDKQVSVGETLGKYNTDFSNVEEAEEAFENYISYKIKGVEEYYEVEF